MKALKRRGIRLVERCIREELHVGQLEPRPDISAHKGPTIRAVLVTLINVQCDEGGELYCKAVPDASPVGRSEDGFLGLVKGWW